MAKTRRRLLSLVLSLVMALSLIPATALAAVVVKDMKLTDHMGNTMEDGDTIQIRVGTQVQIKSYFYDDKGNKIMSLPTPNATWTVGEGGSGCVSVKTTTATQNNWIIGEAPTNEPVTITVAAAYGDSTYTRSFCVDVVAEGIIDGIGFTSLPLNEDGVLEISTSNMQLYAYPTINGELKTQTVQFVTVDRSITGDGIVWSKMDPYGVLIKGGQCTEGAEGTLTVSAAGLTREIPLKVPKPEYRCGLSLYPTGDLTCQDIIDALKELDVGAKIVGEGTPGAYVLLDNNPDVGSEALREQYLKDYPSKGGGKSAASFAATVNTLFFGDQAVISEAAVGNYYFSKNGEPNLFVLYLKMLPGTTVTPDPTQPVTLKLVNLNGGDLTPAAGGGYAITAADITTIEGQYFLYDTVDVNSEYVGNDPDDPVTSWEYATIIEDASGNLVVKPLYSSSIQGTILLTETEVVLLARHNTPDHYVRVVVIGEKQYTDLIGQNFTGKYDEIDDNGKYTPVDFGETLEYKGEKLDYTYQVSLTDYNSLYGGSHSDSEAERAALLAFMKEKRIPCFSERFYMTDATQYYCAFAGQEIEIANDIIENGEQLTIVTYIVSFGPPAYTVTWVDYDGTVLERDLEVEEGTMPSYDSELPTRPASNNYTYTFTGWTPEVEPVTGDVTYTATYQATYIPPYIPPVNPVDPPIDIDDENVPLADLPGLNTVDHYAYIAGYPDGTVRPSGNITRAEVATIFFRLFTDEYRETYWATSNPFSDVAFTAWYNNGVSTAANAGIVAGYPDGTFLPNNNITRAEFATIAARFLSEEYVGPDLFTDISGHWAEEYINRAANAGWINGYPDGSFHPDAYITRAEAVTLVNNMLGRMPHEDHLLADMIVWPDNPETAWYYEAVQEATNSHDYDWATEDEVRLYEIWTELLPQRDWAALEKEWSDAYSSTGADVIDNMNTGR